jgi:hypothetical protein
MKALARIFVLIGVALIANSNANADSASPPVLPDNVFGAPPPKNVKNWIRLSILGIRTHPYTILWLSPQRFDRLYFEKLIVLSPKEYGDVLYLTRSYSCMDPAGAFREKVEVLVTEHSRAFKGNGCILPSTVRCNFLSRLGKFPSIDHTAKNEDLVRYFAEDAGCIQNDETHKSK